MPEDKIYILYKLTSKGEEMVGVFRSWESASNERTKLKEKAFGNSQTQEKFIIAEHTMQ